MCRVADILNVVRLHSDVDEPLLLAPGTSFSYEVTVENVAVDDGLSPILVLKLGNGILLNGTVRTFQIPSKIVPVNFTLCVCVCAGVEFGRCSS